jgi:hypothetical protein
MLRTIVVLIALTTSLNVKSQLSQGVSLSRQLSLEKIDEAQKDIYAAFLKAATDNVTKKTEPISPQLSFSLFDKVDQMENNIQLQPLDSSKKNIYLYGLQEALRSFEYYYKTRQLRDKDIDELVDSYKKAIDLDRQGSSILPVVKGSEVEIGLILVNCSGFKTNIGIYESKEFIVLKVYETKPANILPVLFDNPDVSYADSLIKLIAKTQVEKLYNYAQAINTPLGRRVEKIKEPLVQLVVTLANMRDGQRYFPFLDNLFTGKITIDDIKGTVENGNKGKYYKLLVRTQIEYARRMQQNDTPLAVHALSEMLKKKAVEDFINVINSLHEAEDVIRLKVIKELNPMELYYLVIMGETEIYTSSYLKIYYKIFSLLKKPDAYELLRSVHFNYFRKFIKMAANYNTLDHFMRKMNRVKGETLLKSFAGGLEHSNKMEDAVDVADSYVSISDIYERKIILGEVQKKLSELSLKGDRAGTTAYRLLQTLFLSLDTSKHIDVSSAFGIPSVYTAKNKFLKDSSGRIIIQQFFYGDKDGKTEFKNFINAYSNSNWKITRNPEWVTVSSIRGTPVIIYSNRPLDKTEDLDAKAQSHLNAYLERNSLYPSIVIHRGHSYHVSSTIEQLAPSAKVILIGSCGGYQNLDAVLKRCPYAQIISTKQEGSGRINEPMIIFLTTLLLHGKDLDWQSIWKELEKKFKNDMKFKDYIPPYENLGALFIIGYKSITTDKK